MCPTGHHPPSPTPDDPDDQRTTPTLLAPHAPARPVIRAALNQVLYPRTKPPLVWLVISSLPPSAALLPPRGRVIKAIGFLVAVAYFLAKRFTDYLARSSSCQYTKMPNLALQPRAHSSTHEDANSVYTTIIADNKQVSSIAMFCAK